MSALTDLFTSIANAIREKTGNSDSIQASQFPTAIANISAGGGYKVFGPENLGFATTTISLNVGDMTTITAMVGSSLNIYQYANGLQMFFDTNTMAYGTFNWYYGAYTKNGTFSLSNGVLTLNFGEVPNRATTLLITGT